MSTLKAMLVSFANQKQDPIRRSVALTYLGYLGVDDHRAQLVARADRHTRSVDALPELDSLVNGYADRSRLSVLHRIVDDVQTDNFHALWAHELLAHAGDRSRLPRLRALGASSRTPTADRLKALNLLADLDDHALQATARSIGNDRKLVRTTRLHGLGHLARMEWSASAGMPPSRRAKRPSKSVQALRGALNIRNLSLSERLTLAHHLAATRDERVVPFLYRVVERDRETVVDQIRALNALALTGRRTHVRVLRKAARTRSRASNAAARVLALMGDRSQTAAMVEACRSGNLDAARTLVLTRVLDQLGIPAPDIHTRLRYRMLLDS